MRTTFVYSALLIGTFYYPARVLAAESRPTVVTTHRVVTSPQWATPTVESVLPGVWRVRFGAPERFTPSAIRESAPRAQGFSLLPAPAPLPFEPGHIRCRISSSRTTVYVPCQEPGEEIYGFGLDPGAYMQKGLRKNLTVCANVVGQTGAQSRPRAVLCEHERLWRLCGHRPGSRRARGPAEPQSAGGDDRQQRRAAQDF